MNTNPISRIALLVGEPARTAMLVELMDARVLSASELARAARVTPATASAHLAQMVDARLLRVTPSGRHRYFRLASSEVARMLETLMQLSSGSAQRRVVTGPKDEALRAARTCYDHLAGRLGVAIAQRLVEDGALVLDDERAVLNDRGRAALAELGVAAADAPAAAAMACRPCLDWSERRHHLAGRLAATLCRHCLDERWLLRRPGSRALQITPAGQMALRPWLGARWWQHVEAPGATARAA